ncbi:MAG: efflux RND transporter periplasmic adaptor subunit [Gammaproteobacteria bacterium]|nr:efflux RND transporter periplasmic adaptor subunit [Gammaproteobacteria bacterium]
MSFFHSPKRVIGCCLLVAVSLSACTGGDDEDNKKKDEAALVELAAVQEDSLSYRTERTGTLRAQRTVKLFNQEEGRVLKVLVREDDSVKQGQLLVQLDDRILRAELDKAMATLQQAQQDAKRLEQLKAKQLVAEESLNRALTTQEIAGAEVRLLKTRISYITITAPFSGKIAERKVEPGDVAPKHTHLLTLIDPSKLITDVQVSELALPYMKVGDDAEVRIDALGQQTFVGKIERIYPTVDSATRLGRIEVALFPVPERARAGQFCRVTLSTSQQRHLVIPFSSLRRDASGEFVFLYSDDGTIVRQSIKSGLRLADKVEILEGLTAGQRVVSKGFLGLSEGKKVRAVERRLESEQPQQPADKVQEAPEGPGAKDA